MVWILVMIFSLLIGISIGVILMYYKDRNLLKTYKILNSELKNNKIKLHEYQKRLSNHFSYNMELLDKIEENYRNLYQNIRKNANFFLPNTSHITDSLHIFDMNNKSKTDDKNLSVDVPRDYSENVEIFQKEDNDAK